MKKIIEVKNLYKLYKLGDSAVRALNGVSLEIYEGEFCAIVGTSGSGKSTLIRTLNRLEAIQKGRIVVNGHDVHAPGVDVNALRRDAVADLDANRARNFARLPRAKPVEPPVPYPEDTLSFLGNVFNHKAHDFYVRHGVKVIAAAYEAHEEEGEVSLMITKHCVRFSMSLCPKQAKGVTGVQGTIKAEPLMLINGKEKLTLRFDCKPCEMHVVGKIKRQVLNQVPEAPLQFYKARPQVAH